ncbi:putative toxin-antitoxin system toxin component, PIN family [Chitinispirillales bacterium ANBcel5]|uniref:putative toxin-antitoxin system toxin component, PIN family n=1 Tax=Cellulosispirillum alkaliphilum TaxID=3039283 RepID=UPI002A525C03|nr:putative toxin-antitoxin system toxin component, PIN family [Chitinispirillales bacterium ANBcel5]
MNTNASVVVDTNVFVAAAFNANSASARIVRAIGDNTVNMVWNDRTRDEIVFTISRIPLLSSKSVERLFRRDKKFEKKLNEEDYVSIEDPADRKFAALAFESNSTLISSDMHLLGKRRALKVTVLSPQEFSTRFLDNY